MLQEGRVRMVDGQIAHVRRRLKGTHSRLDALTNVESTSALIISSAISQYWYCIVNITVSLVASSNNQGSESTYIRDLIIIQSLDGSCTSPASNDNVFFRTESSANVTTKYNAVVWHPKIAQRIAKMVVVVSRRYSLAVEGRRVLVDMQGIKLHKIWSQSRV